MDIKLLAVDMDETAVNSRHRMTNETKEALEAAAEKGVFVVPVTGRCLEGLPTKLRGMEQLNYIITSNGAKVYDWKNKTVIYRKLIPVHTACEVIGICQESGLGIAIHCDGKCYDNSKVQAAYRYLVYHRDFKAHPVIENLEEWVRENGKPLEKIQVFSRRQTVLENVREKLENFETLELALSTSGYIEITHREARKGQALVQLCGHLGISMEQVMAIGDNANDYSMLSKAGYPVAMGNAGEDLKKIAKAVTVSNDENGVAYAIYNYLL